MPQSAATLRPSSSERPRDRRCLPREKPAMIYSNPSLHNSAAGFKYSGQWIGPVVGNGGTLTTETQRHRGILEMEEEPVFAQPHGMIESPEELTASSTSPHGDAALFAPGCVHTCRSKLATHV